MHSWHVSREGSWSFVCTGVILASETFIETKVTLGRILQRCVYLINLANLEDAICIHYFLVDFEKSAWIKKMDFISDKMLPRWWSMKMDGNSLDFHLFHNYCHMHARQQHQHHLLWSPTANVFQSIKPTWQLGLTTINLFHNGGIELNLLLANPN